MRVGQGFDVHAFGAEPSSGNASITIGGVEIPYARPLMAHSDGDVLLHALCDALLGALALGDIGHHFPDTDEEWRGANSRDLLRGVFEKISELGFRVENLDCTLIAQAPKFALHIAEMRSNISQDLQIDIERVSIKATTTEQLGFTGRAEGIAAQAIVLLQAK